MNQRAVGAAFVLLGALCSAQERPDLVAKVRSGELKEAKASWWGCPAEDATESLQAAVRSGVPRLVVDNPGRPWVVRPIQLESNQVVVFEDGVVVEAKRGEFKGSNDSLFSISLKANVILRGPGATLRMHRSDYDNPDLYTRAEWRHVLSIKSSRNVEVHGLTLALSGGDGIYLGVAKRGVTNENIVIKGVICDRNYRQGISVISARHLLIEDTVMKDTGGTPPAAGIDFEPNHPTEELVNCVMRNCVTENNFGGGYVFYLPNLHAESAPISIRMQNCVSRRGNRTDFAFITGNNEADTVTGTIDVVGCRFEGSRGRAISIGRKPVAGAAVRFEDCVIDSPASDDLKKAPIVMLSQAGCRRSIGGVDFGEMVVIDSADRPVLDYQDWVGGSGVESVTGTFRIRRDGTETVQELTRDWLAAAFPPRVYKQIAPMALAGVTLVPAGVEVEAVPDPLPAFLRKVGTFVFAAKAGETVALTFVHGQVGKYGGRPMKVVAVSPSGKRIMIGDVPFKETAELRFKAPESGVYHLPINAGANKAAVVAGSHPVAISGEDHPTRFIGPAGDLFFLVPAGTEEFGLLFYGEGEGEAIKATVFDAEGKHVWEKDRITLPEMYAPEGRKYVRDEVWRVRLSKPAGIVCEDNYVDIRGIPPFLARDPRALLKAR